MTTTQWTTEAYETAKRIAKTKIVFTTEDIWTSLLQRNVQLPIGCSARSMGGVIRRMLKEGLIKGSNLMPIEHQDVRNVGRHPHALRRWETI